MLLIHSYHVSWVFTGGTDVEAETPILWPPDAKSWLIRKDPDAGKDWGQEEKGMTEDETVGWHYWLDGHGFGWTPGVGDGQGGLACCGSWVCKKPDTTQRLNWTEPLVYACLVAQSCLTMDPLSCNPPGFLSMGFSRQEYWSGMPFFPSGYLSHPGIEPMSPLLPALQVDSLPTEPSGKLHLVPNKNLVLCL